MPGHELHKRAGICAWLLLLLAVPVLARPPKSGSKTHSSHSSVTSREAAAQKERLRQNLNRVNGHMRQVQAKIHGAKVREHQITETIEVVQGRIDKTRASLASAKSRLSRLTDKHVQLVQRLAETQQHLSSRQQLLARRLLHNYEHGDTVYSQVVLQSRSIHELLSRAFYMRQIVRSDRDILAEIRTDLAQIRSDKAELEAQQREQRAVAMKYEAEKISYAADLNKKREILHGVQQVREQAEDELDDLESEATAMTGRIRALSELLRKRQEAERRAAMAPRRGSKPGRPSAAPVFHGGFQRPCSGPVTSGFGSRFHPILHRQKMHTGVDFGAGYGAAIHAAGSGIVILASYTRGYGNCIIIDHGGGTTTLYGHCSALLVGEGQSVSQGQMIARVGATGLATGPHLHFEVRRGGTPVAPPF